VHELVPAATWQQRFEQINEFERLLTSTGMIVRKFFLHISREEQAKRLRAREEHLEKSWKISASDWRDRKHWDDFIEAYEDAIERCNTDDAPWYVVPADKKWFRNLAICEVIVDALQEHREEWRQALKDLRQQKLAELAKHRH
jgi:polyphosphate kinase 2 (PPK2 family)